jgi:hypothetical protein
MARFAVGMSLALLAISSGLAQTPTATPASVSPLNTLAASLLTQSLNAMGASVPSDSEATGSVRVVAGSDDESGTIRIRTRGLDQSSEDVTLPKGSTSIVYSRGMAKEGGATRPGPLELACSSQSGEFSLAILSAVAADPETTLEYVGRETLNGVTVEHIRFWKTFAARSDLQQLVDFSRKDLWLDSTTALPVKLSFLRRRGGGDVPAIPLDIYYGDYRNVQGVLYPFSISESFNGTPWAQITIGNVALNIGLTDSDFPVR